MVNKIKALAFGAALTACGAPRPTADSGVREATTARRAAVDIAYIRIPSALLTREFIRSTDFNRDHVRDEFYAFGYIRRNVLETLPPEVFQEIVELDAEAFARQAFNPRTLMPVADPMLGRGNERAQDFHNYQALTDEVQRLAQEYPELVHLESAGRSVQGRELWLLKISDNAAVDEDEPKLLYIANMHGDETVGRELMLYLADQLTSQYATSSRIKALVDNSQIFIMPSMNPDGFELHQRYNADGVDLNRDFPDFTADPSDTPQGRAPETQAVMALHAEHHFVQAINFHGGEVCFNMPWDTKPNTERADRFGDDALMVSMGRQYADLNPTMRGNSGGSFDRGLTYGYEWYEVDGGMQDWSIYYRNSMHATVELSMTKWPSSSMLPSFWNENQEALLRHLERGLFGVHLRVLDDAGAPIANATLRLASGDRDVHYRSSAVSRPTLTGPQTVSISAPGYQTQQLQVTPRTFDGSFLELRLRR